MKSLALWLPILLGSCLAVSGAVPDRLVVLTFDDASASHYSVVRPLLKRHGFGATFFITEGFSFATNKRDYLTWPQIKELSDDGFEIGNHTRDHWSVSARNLDPLREQVEAINARCAEHGIPRPVSFAYPGNAIVPAALPILQELGFRFARRGGAPEHPYEWGGGFAYEPGRDHPLLLPSAGDARPDWSRADFQRAVDQARDGRIAILQFHGVPDGEHPWVNTSPERFTQFMEYLATNQFQVIALRDLARYVGDVPPPPDPLAVIRERQAQRPEVLVDGEVVDDVNGTPLPARIYIQGTDGTWYFPKSGHALGSSIRYERQHGANPNTAERHTTLSAHPFRVELRPGRYTFTVERGPEWRPEVREVTVERGLPRLRFRLRRWINMAEQGWYSGDIHHHRHPAELANVMLAEDLNVSLPMMDWTTVSTVAPSASGRGFSGGPEPGPVVIDQTHVWHPRNTEYEIFQTGPVNHTLGAILILNHRTRFDTPVFPLAGIPAQARAEGALLDLEKHNWPWSVALVPILGVDLFELANNHHWRTEYAIRDWAVPAPEWMGIGTGTGTEREWTQYGFQTYYALLNCGFRLRPSAGTANGVHPVPLGFSRVYVRLDGPFRYDAWMEGLAAGRSFVTTGPMLLATVDGRDPGATFAAPADASGYQVVCRVRSEHPLEGVELIVNGNVVQNSVPENRLTPEGALETTVTFRFTPEQSSWMAWRCSETRPGGRIRFAHTARWYFSVEGKPLLPPRREVEWLISRVEEEIRRSQNTAPEDLLMNYRKALEIYQQILATAR